LTPVVGPINYRSLGIIRTNRLPSAAAFYTDYAVARLFLKTDSDDKGGF
jgi:hypothetical protein